MRLHLITCDMLMRPVEHAAATARHELVTSHLSAALHAEPMTLRARIQAEIDRVEVDDPGADAVLLGYGLCGGATAGLRARGRPLVLVRAHDCMTILLGSRERYQREQQATPGTYWFTEDNVERGTALKGWLLGDGERSDEIGATYQGYVERYGRDNADYLMETLGAWQDRYERGVFLDTSLAAGDDAANDLAANRAKADSEARGWRFERVMSDLTLIDRLLDGEWDTDFIVVQPGETLAMSYDADVVTAVRAEVDAVEQR